VCKWVGILPTTGSFRNTSSLDHYSIEFCGNPVLQLSKLPPWLLRSSWSVLFLVLSLYYCLELSQNLLDTRNVFLSAMAILQQSKNKQFQTSLQMGSAVSK
jgi:hypothetical protein